MRFLIQLSFVAIIIGGSGCANPEGDLKNTSVSTDTISNSATDTSSMLKYLRENTPDSTFKPSPVFGYPLIESKVEDVARYLLERLKEKNWPAVSALTSSDHPLRISPKVHLDSNTFTVDGKLLSKLEISGEEIVWYINTASGEPMIMNFTDYFNRYIWDKDYSKAHFHVDEYISRSSLINNLASEFPNCKTVEAFIKTDIKSNPSAIQWRSLNMVFKYMDNKYYLVGLVHDQHEI
ncbi:MAG: hypothetical protein JKY54_08400 [Flavobacteriales bacterium]|nr:hypothetical protein [Flavobacteriales bacterium]